MNKKRWIILSAVAAAAIIIVLVVVLNPGAGHTQAAPSEQATQSVQAEASTPAPSDGPLFTDIEPVATPEPTYTPTPSSAPLPDVKDEEAEFDSDTIELEYYDIAEDTMKKETASVADGASTSYPLELVAKQYFDKPLASSPLAVNSISINGDSVLIDFTDSILNSNLGAYSEGELLDAIANAYLNNMAGINRVYISVSGQDYESGHFSFSKDSPYKMK
ncbi:MAG: hypothetical protein ACOYJB_03100 [Christensenellaceae bacterium]|jgi:hypothetical protein